MTKIEKAMFGAGCFWSVQYNFQKIPGVVKVTSGYSGGKIENPTDDDIYTFATGHVEVVYIEFDPKVVSYNDLLENFWKIHDPTSMDRQGPDAGSIYRSVILYFNDKQKKQAEDSLKKFQKLMPKKIVTEIKKASKFYPAASYHQDFVKRHGVYSCHIGHNPYL